MWRQYHFLKIDCGMFNNNLIQAHYWWNMEVHLTSLDFTVVESNIKYSYYEYSYHFLFIFKYICFFPEFHWTTFYTPDAECPTQWAETPSKKLYFEMNVTGFLRKKHSYISLRFNDSQPRSFVPYVPTYLP